MGHGATGERSLRERRRGNRRGLLVVAVAAIVIAAAACTPGLTDRIDFSGVPWHVTSIGETQTMAGARFWFDLDPGSTGKGHVTINGCGASVDAEVSMTLDDHGIASSGQRISFPNAASLAREVGPSCESLFAALATVQRWHLVDNSSIMLDGEQPVQLQAELGS